MPRCRSGEHATERFLERAAQLIRHGDIQNAAAFLKVLENRDQTTVTDFLQKAHQSGLLKQVTEVTTDMWDGDVNAAKAAFGENVSVVVDRFHVVKNLQERLTAARRLVQKELSEDDRKLLKDSRWL